MNMEKSVEKQVVLVGHCMADTYMLRSYVARVLPQASVTSVSSRKELDPYLRPGVLLLVNRVLDGYFTEAGGIELIRAAQGKGATLMLVSNYEDAQQEAVAAGAVPGFGKSQMGQHLTEDRLKDALAHA